MLQVSIALYGCDVPNSRKDEDKLRRETIFEIVAPYSLSAEDIVAVNEYSDHIRDLWLAITHNYSLLHCNNEFIITYYY